MDDVECDVCTQPYLPDGPRSPWVLGCGHTFCKECIEHLVGRLAAGTQLPCPTCRQEHPVVSRKCGKLNVTLARVVTGFGSTSMRSTPLPAPSGPSTVLAAQQRALLSPASVSQSHAASVPLAHAAPAFGAFAAPAAAQTTSPATASTRVLPSVGAAASLVRPPPAVAALAAAAVAYAPPPAAAAAPAFATLVAPAPVTGGPFSTAALRHASTDCFTAGCIGGCGFRHSAPRSTQLCRDWAVWRSGVHAGGNWCPRGPLCPFTHPHRHVIAMTDCPACPPHGGPARQTGTAHPSRLCSYTLGYPSGLRHGGARVGDAYSECLDWKAHCWCGRGVDCPRGHPMR